MIAHIIYPLPFDNWDVFEQDVYRFIYTFKQFPPECDYSLIPVANYGIPSSEIYRLFYGTKCRWGFFYNEGGADLGSHELVAQTLGERDFIIGLSTRCYFHRAGWGRRLMEARDKHGPGIYGTGDFQHHPHIRTCGYGMDVFYWRSYPAIPDNRPKTVEIESGEYNLTAHVLNEGGKAIQVLWDDEQEQPDWRTPHHTAIFRRGTQGAMLVWDRHTKIFEEASPEEKAGLAALSDPH